MKKSFKPIIQIMVRDFTVPCLNFVFYSIDYIPRFLNIYIFLIDSMVF